jgi:hypothetical protein
LALAELVRLALAGLAATVAALVGFAAALTAACAGAAALAAVFDLEAVVFLAPVSTADFAAATLLLAGLAAGDAAVDFFGATVAFTLLEAVGFFALTVFCALVAAGAAALLRTVLVCDATVAFEEAPRDEAALRPAVFDFAGNAADFDEAAALDLDLVVVLAFAEVVFF